MDEKKKVSRIIAVEEHFLTPSFLEGPGKWLKNRKNADQRIDQLSNLGEKRIAEMDAAGIDLQVLSLNAPGVEQLEAETAVELSHEINDILAATIEAHPDRFAGFACLPTSMPETAADELERRVADHGFKGGLINGHCRGRYLDDTFFWPILERAEALNVPLYLHPTRPPQAIVDTYYTGNFSAEISKRLAMFGWGWHMETAVHILRMVCSGVFDHYPQLQLITGHLGEGLSFMLPRIESRMTPDVTELKRSVGDYFRQNLYYTFGGFYFNSCIMNLLAEVSADRVMFSCDYPYGSLKEGRDFLHQLPVSFPDKEKIAHGNAESFMGIAPQST